MLRKLRKNDLVKTFHIEKIIQELKILKFNKLKQKNQISRISNLYFGGDKNDGKRLEEQRTNYERLWI